MQNLGEGRVVLNAERRLQLHPKRIGLVEKRAMLLDALEKSIAISRKLPAMASRGGARFIRRSVRSVRGPANRVEYRLRGADMSGSAHGLIDLAFLPADGDVAVQPP